MFDLNVDYQYQQTPCEIVYTQEGVDRYLNFKRDEYVCEEGETLFIIVRHGENESNVQGTYDGRTLNMPLTQKGLDQGEAVAYRLRSKVDHIDHVITTSMQRTHQTARKIIEVFESQISEFSIDDRFLERYAGHYEGGPLAAVEHVQKRDKQIQITPNTTFEEKMKFIAEEGVETFAALWKRTHDGLKDAGTALKGNVVLVVTHSGTIRTIYWHLAHQLGFFVPYEHFKPDNGAYMIVSAKDNKLTLLETDDFNLIPPK